MWVKKKAVQIKHKEKNNYNMEEKKINNFALIHNIYLFTINTCIILLLKIFYY